MRFRYLSIYVPREMNEISRFFLVKIYINNVVIFSNTLKKYSNNSIFFGLQKWNIILKTLKTYFEYFTIA